MGEMLGRELWGLYLDRHLPAGTAPLAVAIADAATILDLLWPLAASFGGHRVLAESARYSEAFEADADKALRAVAVAGDLSPVGEASAGAQRVLLDRLDWSMVALAAEEHAGGGFKMPLPAAAPEEIRRMAALLGVLGTFGRSPPPQWRVLADRGSRAAFPGTSRPWRQ